MMKLGTLPGNSRNHGWMELGVDLFCLSYELSDLIFEVFYFFEREK
jgi:hypothetical protein